MIAQSIVDQRWFWIAVVVMALPQLAVAHVYSAAEPQFIALLVLWNVAPLIVAILLFIADARYPAWGWVIGTGLFGLWSVVAVLQSSRSTAALGFIWAPVWSFVIAGPIGAVVGIMVKRERMKKK